MPLTIKKSEQKLKGFSKSSLSNLDPNGETNFFDFYKKNVDCIDYILSIQISKLKFKINPADEKDLCQDILFKLHRCDIIGKFDRNKSAFNTYLTGTIDKYIHSWMKNKYINEHHSWRPWPTCKVYYEKSETDMHLRYEREYYSAINGVNPNFEDVPEDICQETNFEDRYSSKELVECVLDQAPEYLKSLGKLIARGLTCREIAEYFSSSTGAIQSKLIELKKRGQRILKISRYKSI